MSTFECSCVSTVVVNARPRSQTEDLHCRHSAVEDVHFFGGMRLVSRRTFLDLEDCQIADAAESCAKSQAVDTFESCDKKQRWSDEDSHCDTASDIDFEDLDTEDDASSEDATSPSTIPSGPPGVFVMALCLPAASVDLTDAVGFQTPCTDITNAFGFRKPSVVPTDAAKPKVQEAAAADSAGESAAERTTLILKNIPKNSTSASLAKRLDLEGFAGRYDFVYVPLDLQLGACFGYAFVNMALAEDGVAFMKKFRGAKGWAEDQELEVDWSERQGLEKHTEKCRNSPLMHVSIADEAKPLLFKNGVNVPFPKPTKMIKQPRGGCMNRRKQDA